MYVAAIVCYICLYFYVSISCAVEEKIVDGLVFRGCISVQEQKIPDALVFVPLDLHLMTVTQQLLTEI